MICCSARDLLVPIYVYAISTNRVVLFINHCLGYCTSLSIVNVGYISVFVY
jgi:hypothetical protein